MRKVGKAAIVALMTPMTVAAIAVGANASTNAANPCPLLGSPKATITPPSGSIAAGSKVHVSALVCGLVSTHLQISGPGLDQQVGSKVGNGVIEGDVTVPKAGHFTLTVIGNITKRTYDTSGFSVQERAVPPTPTHSRTPSKSPKSGGSGGGSGSSYSLPSGSGNSASGGAGGPGGSVPQQLNYNSPFSLPSIAPDGAGAGFVYPTPDPEIASPAAKVQANDTSQTTQIKWGQSIAAALVLLLLSAHFGMWSRRQRLAAEARAAQGGPGGNKGPGRPGRKSDRSGLDRKNLGRKKWPGTRRPTDVAVRRRDGVQERPGADEPNAARSGYRGRRRRP